MRSTVVRFRGKDKRILRHSRRRGGTPDERNRAAVVLALREGSTPREVSRILGVALCTVYRVRDLFAGLSGAGWYGDWLGWDHGR